MQRRLPPSCSLFCVRLCRLCLCAVSIVCAAVRPACRCCSLLVAVPLLALAGLAATCSASWLTAREQ
jgi:hypothetical protein